MQRGGGGRKRLGFAIEKREGKEMINRCIEDEKSWRVGGVPMLLLY